MTTRGNGNGIEMVEFARSKPPSAAVPASGVGAASAFKAAGWPAGFGGFGTTGQPSLFQATAISKPTKNNSNRNWNAGYFPGRSRGAYRHRKNRRNVTRRRRFARK